MDLFPLINSLRVALTATAVTFFAGIAAAHYVSGAGRLVRSALDAVLTLPLVLPPTVIGFFLLKLLGPNAAVGAFIERAFGFRLVMRWYSAIFASVIVAFPLMYRTARGAFQSFDADLKYAGQTLGLSNTYIFWRVTLPCCRQGIIAGTILSFARALGEYGATSMLSGYTPGKTATISTTVYQLWRTGDDARAYAWALVNIAISCVVLVALNFFERGRARRA
ncbi:MAG: molybdate ABC transporter permease subunit [Oscillospiraceae bacterium]|jgi:molybdate transport system permease protein|nr:molybdate ABC transporter permease subunit [Oscillospiraceae bacterium]